MLKRNFTRSLCVLFLLLGLCATCCARPVHLRNGHPTRYTVQPGDTLWGIAGKFLDDPLQWPQLFRSNQQLDNPSHIYPGQVLELQLVNGEPALYAYAGGTVKLSPRVRSVPLDSAIPPIPLDAIQPFLDGTSVVNENELDHAPYILAHEGEHVVAGAGDEIYIQDIPQHSPYTKYWIFRKGSAYIDPETREVLGFAALHIGQTELVRSGDSNTPSTFLITEARREVLKGDRLMPRTNQIEIKDFEPKLPKRLIHGQLISVLGGVTQIGQYQVVVIDRGARNGLRVGDVLAIDQVGRKVKDPAPETNKAFIKLPNERAGELMVFRVFEKVSYGLVLQATRAIHLLDVVTNPV